MSRTALHSRRRFLWSMGLGCATVATGCRPSATPTATSPPDQSPASPTLVNRTSRALGTKVSLTIAPPDGADADAILSAAFDALNQLEDVMSLYRPTSQLCELNRTGRLADADPMLIKVLKQASRIASMTGGVFDVTVQPLWDLYANHAAPTNQQLTAAKSLVDYRRVAIKGDQVTLEKDAQITLNGIAQGFAVDVVRETLAAHGVTAAMIDTGEIGTLGEKENAPWRAGIQHPTVEDAFAAVVAMDGRCLATSGDYATRLPNGQHHLLDPRTGRSANSLSSVSVLADSGLLADAISTAAFLLGPVEGMRLVRELNADAMMITAGAGNAAAKTLTTRGFPHA